VQNLHPIASFIQTVLQVFFNTKVAILKTQRARLNEEAGKMGGGTAFYDSTMKALASMQVSKHFVFALTLLHKANCTWKVFQEMKNQMKLLASHADVINLISYKKILKIE